MLSGTVLISLLAALADARFGQEQIPIPAIQAVTSGGGPGVAATLAGSAISTLLGAADPCAKLQKADQIVAELGTGADSIAAAKGLVAAEQNFNPSAVHVPSICSDPTLPTTAVLRGVVPLVDPAVGGSATENANSKTSLSSPFSAAGMSVAQIMAAHGFVNFTTKAAASAPASAVESPASKVAAVLKSTSKGSVSTLTTVTVASTLAPKTSAAAGAVSKSASSLGLDFGTCTPTMKFEAGLAGRQVTEFTFQAIDPLINKGQEEALNPNIITNKICDQLVNVCNAAANAHEACLSAKTQIAGLGTRNQSTADAWNSALGFAGTNTNPDNAPQPGLIGHS